MDGALFADGHSPNGQVLARTDGHTFDSGKTALLLRTHGRGDGCLIQRGNMDRVRPAISVRTLGATNRVSMGDTELWLYLRLYITGYTPGRLIPFFGTA